MLPYCTRKIIESRNKALHHCVNPSRKSILGFSSRPRVVIDDVRPGHIFRNPAASILEVDEFIPQSYHVEDNPLRDVALHVHRDIHTHFILISQSLVRRKELTETRAASDCKFIDTSKSANVPRRDTFDIRRSRSNEILKLLSHENETKQAPSESLLSEPIPSHPRLWLLDDFTVVGKSELDAQIRLEEHVTDEAIAKYRGYADSMTKLGKAGTVPALQKQIRSWYYAVRNHIEVEQGRVWENSAGRGSKIYGPLLVLLQPDKLAVMVLHEVLNSCLKCSNTGVPAATLCIKLADAAQSEVNLLKLQNKLGGSVLKTLSGSARSHVREVNIRAKRALDVLEFTEWSIALKVQLGAALVRCLCNSAKISVDSNSETEKAFMHEIRRIEPKKTVGMLSLTPNAYEKVNQLNSMGSMQIRFPPMLVPPRLWQRHDRGAYFRLKSRIMRTKGCTGQIDALRTAKLDRVFHCVNCLGALPWRINDDVCNVVKEAWKRKLTIGELPPQDNIPVPQKPKNCQKWFSSGEKDSSEFKLNPKWQQFDQEKKAYLKAIQCNKDRHSLRSDLKLKLDIMDRFSGKIIYFPHNLDFRGRAYPMPPHLNHMGDDLSRGSLRFAEAKPLGDRGLYWLKVQACSLWGLDKLSFDARRDYTDQNIELIRGSAEDPLGPRGEWWTKADSPWQCLATCRELIEAIDSGNPEGFMSRLPIHQDGSCNGLQHYAALGRDYFGGEQVNLLPGDAPRDVYSSVCERVKKEIKILVENSMNGDGKEENKNMCARLLDGIVDRKVVKQTVMTSVYGVTFFGARRQIQARLEERINTELHPHEQYDPEKIYTQCATVLTTLTLGALKGLFSEARSIMDWLGQLAGIVSHHGQPMTWVTPLGLPVVQPYRRDTELIVRTVLQKMKLNNGNDNLPVAGRRQRSAFPPNFIHSLDSTHMLMTASAMDKRGLPFTAVHDSYWCHAGNVDEMNRVLRDAFIDLYSHPILEELHESLCLRYPGVYFPPVPPRGTLNLEQVRDSKYFFN